MICSQCNKEFTKTHHRQKHCSKACSKEALKSVKKKYSQSDKGKEVKKKSGKKYKQSEKGKKSIARYNQSDKRKAADKKFKQSDKGKKAGRDLYHKQYNSDVMFKLKHIARARLSSVLKSKNIKKPTTKTQNFKSTTIELFGCTPEYLKKHLEKQFHRHPDTHQLMNWKNHTVHGWHIDHRIPLDSAKTSEDIVKLNHYTNLRPMWATENLKKGNKIN